MAGGVGSAPAHRWRRYARDFALINFVETGTYLGDTISELASTFHTCFTVELSDSLHAAATQRLSAFSNVNCLLGDSASVLPQILRSLDGPALFWLDAHASGGATANSGRGPIFGELDAIFAHGCKAHVILIDDARGHDIREIAQIVPSCFKFSVRNDIARIVPAI
jgi:hypothetical protein